MRTINTTLIRVEPFATVAPACPSLRENSALLQNSAAKLPGFAVFGFPLSWPAAAAAPAAVTARPKSRVAATGVGYAGPDAAETRREVDGIGRDVPRGMAGETRLNGINGTNGKQQGQLHLMSRRDPRSWRPPA